MFNSLLKNAIKHFIDELNRLLLLIDCLLFLVSLFVKNFYLDLSTFLLFFFILYRLFSKNKEKRKKENTFYLKIKNKIVHPLQKKPQDKQSIYKKCKKCNTTLKLPLPKKRGLSHAKCPSCGNLVSIFLIKSVIL